MWDMATAGNFNIKLLSSACKICEEEEKAERPGVKYCTICSHWLCSTCIDSHNRFPAMRNHVMEDEKSSQKLSQSACSSHPSMMLMYFCSVCDVCICPLCRLDDGQHTGHDSVSLERRVTEIKTSLKTTLSNLHSDKTKVEDYQHVVNKERSSVCDWMADFERDMQKAIVEQRTALTKKFDKVAELLEEELKSITAHINTSQQYLDDVNAVFSVTDLLKLTATGTELPEVPTFEKGPYETSLRIVSGEQMTPQNITPILGLVDVEQLQSSDLHAACLRLMLGRKLTSKQKTLLVNTILTSEEVGELLVPGVRVRLGRDWPEKWGRRGRTGTALMRRNGHKALEVQWDNDGRQWLSMGDHGRYDLDVLF